MFFFSLPEHNTLTIKYLKIAIFVYLYPSKLFVKDLLNIFAPVFRSKRFVVMSPIQSIFIHSQSQDTHLEQQTTNIAQDSNIIAGIRSGDQRALKLLYNKYSKALQGVIMRIVDDHETSEDLLQDAFVKIWQNFHTYDENKGRIYTWMLNIARNLAIDKIRSPKFSEGKKIRDIEDSVNRIDASNNIKYEPDHIGIDQVVGKLRPEYKEVIDLVYFFGYSQSEAAEKLNIPLGTVKTRIRSAMIELRKVFK